MRRHTRFSALTATTVLLLTLATPAAARTHTHELPGIPQIGEVLVTQTLEYVQARHDADVAAYQALTDAAEADAAVARLVAQPPPASSSSGPHSDAWWAGVTQCEQGGQDNPTFGYFSIMDGSAAGYSYADQLAMARAIDARAGDGAWAQSCQDAGWASSPGG